ncbi:hypothetical protein [Nocardia thraciensis]
MSGVGKSSLLRELARRGHRTVDIDYSDYFETRGRRAGNRDDRPRRAGRRHPADARALLERQLTHQRSRT